MKQSNEAIERLNALKKHIFFELLDITGRVFIVVRYHKDVVIGKRGFLPEEKEKGIVLVFNKRMKFQWQEWGIEATLVFGTQTEHCLIPVDHIIGVYSPEINTQFLSLFDTDKTASTYKPSEENTETLQAKEETKEKEKVIKVDFRKKG